MSIQAPTAMRSVVIEVPSDESRLLRLVAGDGVAVGVTTPASGQGVRADMFPAEARVA